MRRRTFISFLGGAAAAWPLLAQAQQSGKIPTVGVLWYAGSAEEEDIYLSVLVKAFHDLGYVEGKNIHLDHRFPAENPDRFRALAQELVDEKPDVIIAVTLLGALELKGDAYHSDCICPCTRSNRLWTCRKPGTTRRQYDRPFADGGLQCQRRKNDQGNENTSIPIFSLGFIHSLIVLMMLDSDRALLLIEYLSRARTISSYSGSVVTGSFGTMCTIL